MDNGSRYYISQMEIALGQITKFNGYTKYACATFGSLIGTEVHEKTKVNGHRNGWGGLFVVIRTRNRILTKHL